MRALNIALLPELKIVLYTISPAFDDNHLKLMYKVRAESALTPESPMPDSPTSEPESDFACDCDESMRSACAGEPFYKEHEDKQYCVLHFPGKQKSVPFNHAFHRKLKKQDFDFRGVWFPDRVLFAGFFRAAFQTPADFSGATFSGPADFSGAEFKAGATFTDVKFDAGGYFTGTKFTGGETNFSRASFTVVAYFGGALFHEQASFSSTKFNAFTDFSWATFGASANFTDSEFGMQAEFRGATFKEIVYFTGSTFGARAEFGWAIFNSDAFFTSAEFRAPTDFTGVTFNAKVEFARTIFDDAVRFAGAQNRPDFSESSSLNLQFARTNKPYQISFHSLTLQPEWFVNVDPRQFAFVNVDWLSRSLKEQIQVLTRENILPPHGLLAITCRQLAVNAEENHRYEEASRFRYMAMDLRRLESLRGFAPWRLSWWYWLASGYGERVLRAFVVVLGIWAIAGLLYTRVGFARWEPKLASEADVATAKRDNTGAPLNFRRALTYSAAVMTFQRPEPKPATTTAQTIVLIETILGPVQAALLALAVRRKFMR